MTERQNVVKLTKVVGVRTITVRMLNNFAYNIRVFGM